MEHSPSSPIGTEADDPDASMLLNVVNAFILLTKKCQDLESAVSETQHQADDDVAQARNIVRRWEVYVETLNARIDWLSEEVVSAEARATASEAKLAQTVAKATADIEAAQTAEAEAGRFQQQIATLLSDVAGRCSFDSLLTGAPRAVSQPH